MRHEPHHWPHRTQSRRAILKAFLAGSMLIAPQVGWAEGEVVGAVSEVKGEATGAIGNDSRKLAAKSPVHLGETLATAADSRLKARLAQKTTLKLGAETKVKIDSFIVNSGGELELSSGALLLEAPAGKFKKGLDVTSPYALIAVRGTSFFAGVIDGVFGVFVQRGVVEVTAAGKSVELHAGDGTDIAKPGDPPGPVKQWRQPRIDKAMALVS